MSIALSGSLSFTGSFLITNSNSAISLNGSILGTGGITNVSMPYTANYYNPKENAVQVATQVGQGSLHMQPALINVPVQFDRMVLPVAYSNLANRSNTFSVSFYAGFYTNNNSTLSLSTSLSTSYAISNSGTQGIYSSVGGTRNLSIGGTGIINPGMYYVGILSSTDTNGTGMTMSNFIQSQLNISFSGTFGISSATSAQMTQGLGMYSAVTNALPSTIGLNQINGLSSVYLRPYVFALSNGTATSV